MIARYSILLPFDLFIVEVEDNAWPIVEGTAGDYRFRVLPPCLIAERPKPTDSLLAQGIGKISLPSFTDNLLVNGKRVAQVNVLIVDLIKPEFNRSEDAPLDPKPELAFEIANQMLARLRVYSRAFQIKPLVFNTHAWHLSYLTDELQELERADGMRRGYGNFCVTGGGAAITPDIIQLLTPNWQKPEPYVWDQLLLDAFGQLPDVGSSIVMAYAALETFIAWAIEILHQEWPLPSGLWEWIKKRDHWSKEPSVSEQFGILLTAFTSRSLKQEEPGLWESFSCLRNARNAVAHEGVAAISRGKEAVDAAKAAKLVYDAEKIIVWIEQLLPEPHRRLRTTAIGPFVRRMATPEEAEAWGPAHVKKGQLGSLAPGASILLGFGPKPDESTTTTPDNAKPSSMPPGKAAEPLE